MRIGGTDHGFGKRCRNRGLSPVFCFPGVQGRAADRRSVPCNAGLDTDGPVGTSSFMLKEFIEPRSSPK